jgi:hypothetical protein
MITFKEYQTKTETLYSNLDKASKMLAKISQNHRDTLGLIPVSIRISEPYKAAKLAYDIAFNNVRTFNGSMPKEYKQRNRRY